MDFLVLWTGLQADDIGVADIQQDLFLGVQMHELVLFNDLLLAHYLKSVDFRLALEPHQLDPPKSAVPKSAHDLQIVFLQLPQDLVVPLFKFLHNSLMQL